MMHDFNRDLLLLPKAACLSPEEFNRELEILDTILYPIETWKSFCEANELVDINRRKIITQPHLVERILREGKQKSFVFIRNKN